MFRLLCFLLLFFASFSCGAQGGRSEAETTTEAGQQKETAEQRLRAKADSALVYCREHRMNTQFCVLVDMAEHAGRYRFWVWDFDKGEATVSSLCCHGYGGGSTIAQPVFSNVPGSYCTSLGKYRIGARAYSQWGIHVHYKLHGLEATNDNAYKRIIVLHSYTPMPTEEVWPRYLPMGWSLGCPVVSDEAMTALDGLLGSASPPVLLWIYY